MPWIETRVRRHRRRRPRRWPWALGVAVLACALVGGLAWMAAR